MRTPRTFRPQLSEPLEDRAVPSLFGFEGFGRGGGLGNAIGSLPARDAQLVRQDFLNFERSYSQDVQSILFNRSTAGTTAGSTVDLSANRAKFDAAVAQLINDPTNGLLAQVDQHIANLAASNPNLRAGIVAALSGNGPNTNSLPTLLDAMAMPTSLSFQTQRQFVRQGIGNIESIGGQVVQQIRSATAPAGSVSQQQVQAVLNAIQTAFNNFTQSYYADAQANLPTNRTQFNQAVVTDLGTLNSGIATALNSFPTTLVDSLTTTVRNDLLSSANPPTGTNLQARLAAIPTPSQSFFGPFFFRLRSSLAIGLAQRQVTNDILTAVRQFNASV